ncbi:hypothetical protein [Streptococcus plurextorum]
MLIQFTPSATSFDICADFSVAPLPVTNGVQNTSDNCYCNKLDLEKQGI